METVRTGPIPKLRPRLGCFLPSQLRTERSVPIAQHRIRDTPHPSPVPVRPPVMTSKEINELQRVISMKWDELNDTSSCEDSAALTRSPSGEWVDCDTFGDKV